MDKLKKNKKINRLKAIKFVYNKIRTPYWQFKCDCGNMILASIYHVLRGRIKSCGCYRKENVHNKLGFGISTRNAIYYRYKMQAKQRNLDFMLEKEVFFNLIKQNCFYCGTKPSAKYKMIKKHGYCIYNGIDRINNDIGYCKGNVIPCCKICNMAKRTLTKRKFLNWIRKTYEFNFI